MVYLTEDLLEPHNAILAQLQILFMDADLSVFVEQQELFLRAIPILVQMLILVYSRPRGNLHATHEYTPHKFLLLDLLHAA